MMSDSTYRCLTLWALALLVVSVVAQDFSFEENIKELIARRKNMDYMRQIVEDMDHQLNRLHQRACFLGWSGMDCNSGGMAMNLNAWSTEDSPGKKRRSNICYKIGNPEGCLGKVIDDNKKDTSHWGNPDSPGKK